MTAFALANIPQSNNSLMAAGLKMTSSRQAYGLRFAPRVRGRRRIVANVESTRPDVTMPLIRIGEILQIDVASESPGGGFVQRYRKVGSPVARVGTTGPVGVIV